MLCACVGAIGDWYQHYRDGLKMSPKNNCSERVLSSRSCDHRILLSLSCLSSVRLDLMSLLSFTSDADTLLQERTAWATVI